ncbi:MAG: DUF763 domain-containing protein [Saprospiraceae bacterium]|nr:DUF763 domain-containing protein [Saprospiraceae bacterium]
MKRSGYSDLPLHGGRVPRWLYSRMARLGSAIIEVIVSEYGPAEFLSRMSDPFWFQSFGAVLGMDWHSSGITTAVMGALKGPVNQMSSDLGIYICGGRGNHSRATPKELFEIAAQIGLDGDYLMRTSRLSAKIDNTAIQDGFQLYLHNFILTKDGDWSVIQQGMNPALQLARRYHWHGANVKSFLEDPHTSIVGPNMGEILNLVDKNAGPSRQGVLDIVKESPAHMISELPYLKMPKHHDVRFTDVDLRRLGTMLYQTHDAGLQDFESLLLFQGMGPRTLQSLALVSEVIYGTPTRFNDPARFSFAHGGKDGHPFPVPTKVYDETINFLDKVISQSKVTRSDKLQACKALYEISKRNEKDFEIDQSKYEAYLQHERDLSSALGGRTVFQDIKKADQNRSAQNHQLELF